MATDSGRLREACAPAHTGRGQGHPDTSYRVPKRPSGRSSARRVGPQVLQRHHGVAKGGFWRVFGTATLPTGTSGPSSRGEASPNRSQNGPFPIHQSVFGTESRPTGTSGASPRGEQTISGRPAGYGQQWSADATSGQRTFSQRMPAAVGKQSSSCRSTDARGCQQLQVS